MRLAARDSLGVGRDFNSVALLAAEVLTFDEFSDGVLEPLRIATAGSGIVLYQADRDAGLRALGGNLVEAIPHYVVRVMSEDPVRRVLLNRYAHADPSAPMAWIAREAPELDWVEYGRSAAHSFYREYDAEDIILMAMTSPSTAPPIEIAPARILEKPAAIFVARSERQKPFDRNVLRRINWVLPHLQAAVRRIERWPAMREICDRTASASSLGTRFGLTRAEVGVLLLLADGLSNAEIARRLFVSIETVRTHARRVLSKLGVRTRGRAAAIARGG